MTPGCTSAPRVIEGLGMVTPPMHRRTPLRQLFANCEPCAMRTIRWMQASPNPHIREKGAHTAWQESQRRDMTEFKAYWEAYGYGVTK